MGRQKIDFGIDLGTTNSAIAHAKDGDINILKSETQADTSPSCVQFNKKQVLFVGDKAFNGYRRDALRTFRRIGEDGGSGQTNAFIEFKRTMGTDKMYYSSYMDHSYSSEKLSSEVLKKLKSHVQDENITAAVVTVPAKFRQNQLEATQRAADLAGLTYCELLQEPIAASLAYGVDVQNIDGFWVVFDFGGGTFDAALMKVDEGIMKVVDTEGDNHLGGKNLDYAIVDQILIPHLEKEYKLDSVLTDEKKRMIFRDALKVLAEEAKVMLSSKNAYEFYTDEPLGLDDDEEDIELDLRITLQDYEAVVAPIFQRAIDITISLLQRNNLDGAHLETIVMVGGPTFSQTLRRMLREQISPSLETSIDPMTAVAKGAALYASTRSVPIDLRKRDLSKIQLQLKYPETTVEMEEILGIRIDRAGTSGEVPAKVWVEVTRGDKAWSTGKIEIEEADILNLQLNSGKTNHFDVTVYHENGDVIPCEPHGFNIIQGIKVANATLPLNIGIIVTDGSKGKSIFQSLKGLEKNATLPAKGRGTFRTQRDIRPGNTEDIIKFPLYEGEHGADGTPAILNERINEVVITGENITQLLPTDSEVELILDVDSSRRIKFSAYFPYLDETLDLAVPEERQAEYEAEELEQEIEAAKESLESLKKEAPTADPEQQQNVDQALDEVSELLENGKGDYNTKTQVKERIREALKELEQLQEDSEWPKVEKELDDALTDLKDTVARHGDDKSQRIANQLQQLAETARTRKNAKVAQDIITRISQFTFSLMSESISMWMGYIMHYDENFDTIQWKNQARARQLVNEGKSEMNQANPSKPALERIVRELSGLVPEGETQNSGRPAGGDSDLLKL